MWISCSLPPLSLFRVQLFRRIMTSARKKQNHNFCLSYQLEVGSSVDPDMEDISGWEDELQGLALQQHGQNSPR